MKHSGSVSPASPAQREKVAGKACVRCGRGPCDPMHLAARGRGGCDDPLCVVPGCRVCHREFDGSPGIDLLPHLEPDYRVELAHAVLHLGLIGALERVTHERWRAAA